MNAVAAADATDVAYSRPAANDSGSVVEHCGQHLPPVFDGGR